MSQCKTYTMNKAELEHYLKKKYGDKIGPVNHEPRKKSTAFRSDQYRAMDLITWEGEPK